MNAERARADAERALRRQTIMHHAKREEELERLLADFIALAQHKPHCKCEASKGLRHLASELEGSR